MCTEGVQGNGIDNESNVRSKEYEMCTDIIAEMIITFYTKKLKEEEKE